MDAVNGPTTATGPPTRVEVHDPEILTRARAVLDACRTPQEMQQAVLAAVARNRA